MAKAWKRTNLKLVYTYQNDEFKDCSKSKTYSYVDQNASEGDLYEVACGIASLQQYQLSEVQHIEINTLSEKNIKKGGLVYENY